MKIAPTTKRLFSAMILNASLIVQVNAGGTSGGAVLSIYTTAYGQVFVSTAAVATQPACSIYGWAIDLNGSAATGGKAMLATLMWAQATGKQVTIVGKGNCDVWGDRETVIAVIAT